MKVIDPHSSFFITANHTGAGKTLLSYLICRRYGQTYFKPVESGTPNDSSQIKSWGDVKVMPSLYSFAPEAPPHFLAQQEKKKITIANIMSHLPARPVVLESAGGWFSPLNDTETMADLALALRLPVLAVMRCYLGSINHAVLTLEAILQSRLPIAGYVINEEDTYGMGNFLQHRFPELRCLAQLPTLTPNSLKNFILNL